MGYAGVSWAGVDPGTRVKEGRERVIRGYVVYLCEYGPGFRRVDRHGAVERGDVLRVGVQGWVGLYSIPTLRQSLVVR